MSSPINPAWRDGRRPVAHRYRVVAALLWAAWAARGTLRALSTTPGIPVPERRAVRRDPWYIRVPLILLVVLFLAVMVVLPLANVFAQAFGRGWDVFQKAWTDRDTL